MRRLAAGAPLLAVALLQGCSIGSSEAPPGSAAPPAEVVQIEGTDRSQVILTEDAARRIGIATQAARGAPGSSLVVIPAAALSYDTEGQTWVWTPVEPRKFERKAVTVARIEGDNALLEAGLAVGALVVTVGGAELFGAETGVAGE